LGFGYRTDYTGFPGHITGNHVHEDLTQLQRQLVPLASRALVRTLQKALCQPNNTHIKRLRWSTAQRK
jgi:hypothetical protein